MLGAIAGDVIGSVHEGAPPQPVDFPLFSARSRFTDDSVMTIAVAHAIRTGTDYATALRRWGRRYPHAGYGGWFRHWLVDDTAGPYGSFGNGSAMRVSAVGWAFDDESAVLEQAAASAAVTHDHPEGIKGAQAVALAVLLGRQGHSMKAIRRRLEQDFGYDCSADLAGLRATLGFDVSCQGTVPAAMVAVLAADSVEGAIRNAVSLGGDADTTACIAGAIAEAGFGGVPAVLREPVLTRLDAPLAAEVEACIGHFRLPLP